MTKLARFGAVAFVVFGSALPVLAEGETAATVVARVNGQEITLGQMIAAREALPPQYQALPDDVLFKGVMEQLVQQEVLSQSVTTTSARDEANLKNNRLAYLASVEIGKVIDTAVTDAALQAAYDARYKDAVAQKEYSAAHILVETEEKAKELKAQIDGGASFADLAKEHSTDPGSGAQGGALGWFGLGMMVKPFEDAVVAAELGKVSDPVQSDFGWHLILVNETRDAAQPTLDDLRGELAAEIENSAIESHITSLTEAAKVEKPGETLDPALLKNSDLLK